ncbi:hypothetical protein PIROE2DRAFT_15712 [Piromyces sp. E2]|nr:hypothetical protein PIROE2DRAFT_15712 [Piromyces sp. E2]|eukprot:OUM58907.1 hypothetical protein PIROE2DRAFT_15712 [Piromyces sp. E2]
MNDTSKFIYLKLTSNRDYMDSGGILIRMVQLSIHDNLRKISNYIHTHNGYLKKT